MICEYYEICVLLESEVVVKVFCSGIDILWIVQVYYVVEKVFVENNLVEYFDLNQVFYMEIWNVVGNEKMKMLFCNMWNGLLMGYKVIEEEYVVIFIQEYKSIL